MLSVPNDFCIKWKLPFHLGTLQRNFYMEYGLKIALEMRTGDVKDELKIIPLLVHGERVLCNSHLK